VQPEFFQKIVEQSLDGIVALDPEGRVLYQNEAAAQISGYGWGTLHQGGGEELLHPEDRAAEQDFFRTLHQKHGHSEVRLFRLRHKDGHYIDLEARFTNLLDVPGVGAIVVRYRDITQTRAAQQQLLWQASLLDQAREAIMVRDAGQRIVYWNRGAERMFGYKAAEVLGQNLVTRLYRDPEAFQNATDLLFAEGAWHGELEIRSRDGADIVVEADWSIVNDLDGRPSILAVNSDITERKKLQEQFTRAQRLESIGTLAGGIAHDLNNVLTPIMLATELLKMSTEDPESLELVATIERNTRRGAEIVRQVLTFSRGSSGQQTPIDLHVLLKDIATIIGDTFPKDIQFQLEAPADLATVLGDLTQLHQVLLNICLNARDAMPQGGNLILRASHAEVDESYALMSGARRAGLYVCLEVEDSGTGMSKEVQDKLFDPFFTTKDTGKGTGLGLSTTLALVRGHGGFIRVYSEVGKGSVFRVFLPGESLPATAEAAPGTAAVRGKGQQILVIDDEAGVRDLLKRTLETHGYRVLLAEDGARGLAAFARNRICIDLVITDVLMPAMDGVTLIKALREMVPEIKILAMSGLTSREKNMARLTGNGPIPFLAKPYTAEALLALVHDLLG